MNTIENNIKIAKFMGETVTRFSWRDFESLVFCDEDRNYDMRYLSYYNPDRDWNQLMHVLNKIEQMGYDTTIWHVQGFTKVRIYQKIPNQQYCVFKDDVVAVSKMEAIYKAILQFIDWHNDNAQDETKS